MAASESGPKPMPTAHEIEPGCSLPGRRAFMKQSAGAVATIVTAGAASSTALADDDEGDDLPQPGVGGSSGRHDLEDIADSAQYLYDSIAGVFSSGYSEEDVDEATSNNLHWGIFQSLESIAGHTHGFLNETEEWVNPTDPLSGTLESVAWGETRSTIFQMMDDGYSSTEARDEASVVAQDYLSERQRNYIRQRNEEIFDYVRHFANFVDLDELEDEWPDAHPEADLEDSDLNHDEGELFEDGLEEMEMGETDDGLDPDDIFRFESYEEENDFNSTSPPTEPGFQHMSVDTEEIELINGDTEQGYVLEIELEWETSHSGDIVTNNPTMEFTATGTDLHGANVAGEAPPASRTVFYYIYELSVLDPDEDQEVTWYEQHSNESEGVAPTDPWEAIFDAIDEVYSEFESEIAQYTTEVFDAYDDEEIHPEDILSPTDYIDEYGDSDEVTRTHAELVGLGMAPPEDTGTTVTLSSDSDELDETTEGTLYLDWNWETLEDWEYELEYEEIENEDYDEDEDDDEDEYGEVLDKFVLDEDSYYAESVLLFDFEDDDDILEDFEYEDDDFEGYLPVPMDDLEDTDDGHEYDFDDPDLEVENEDYDEDEDDEEDEYESIDIDDLGDLEDISIEPAGELHSFIPVDEEVDGEATHAIFVDSEGDRTTFDSDSSFEIESIEDEDGDDLERYYIEDYEQTARDPARALEDSLYYSDQRETTDDLEEQSADLPGLPSAPDLGQGAGLLGLGLIGVVILAVIGFVTDLIPGLGN